MDSLYFSVVTITTLSYGDILPTGDMTKALVSFEALLGIGFFGIFLSMLWSAHSKAREAKSISESMAYHAVSFESVLEAYKASLYEITCNNYIQEANTRPVDVTLKSDFNISSLATIYADSQNTTLTARFGIYQPKLAIFYMLEEQLINELKDLKFEWKLDDEKKLRNIINSFLQVTNKYDVKHLLLQYINPGYKLGEEPYKMALERHISKLQAVPQGKSMFSEITNLYYGIYWKIECIKELENEFRAIKERYE